MARPERKTVDYFPHYISDGKKMFFIEQKYGNDGYASWFKILESLANTNDHFLNLTNKMDLLFLSAKCRVDEDVIVAILDDLCMLGEIDEFLWLNRIVYSHKFIESIQDAYSRRSNKCMNYDSFCIHYSSLCTTKTRLLYEKERNNPQSKVKYTKSKESKEEESNPQTPKGDSFDFDNLLIFFNETFGKSSRIINDATRNKYNARLKEGYSKMDIKNAMQNASKDDFHKQSNYKHCTLEFFSRAEKIDKFINFKGNGNGTGTNNRSNQARSVQQQIVDEYD